MLQQGGHFAALQDPALFLEDIEEFLGIVGSSVIST